MSNPVSDLLYEILIQEDRGLVAQVAEVAGCARSTVYDQTSGRANPSVNVITAAASVTRDPRLLKILTPTGMKIVPDVSHAHPTGSLVEEIGDIAEAAGFVRRLAREAMADGILDAAEMVAIKKSLDAVRRELADVDRWLEQGGPDAS